MYPIPIWNTKETYQMLLGVNVNWLKTRSNTLPLQ